MENGQNQERTDILFLRELFDIDDIRIVPLSHIYNFDVYMSNRLVLWMRFDGEILEFAKPSNMQIKKRFVVKDESISEIRRCVEKLWIENYVDLAKSD